MSGDGNNIVEGVEDGLKEVEGERMGGISTARELSREIGEIIRQRNR